MLEKVLGKQHIKINMWIFVGLFVAMFLAPFVNNTGVKILILLVILVAFVNALSIGYKFVKYNISRNKELK